MSRSARLLLLASLALLAGAFTGSAGAATLSLDSGYGHGRSHSVTIPALGKTQADVAGFEVDSKGRAVVMSNNGRPPELRQRSAQLIGHVDVEL